MRSKASEADGLIEVYGHLMKDGYCFEVKDHGVGIPKEELHKITKAFYMVDKSRSRSRNGAGLGLALCAEILELHKSRLNIRSELGKGTTMSFTPAPLEGGPVMRRMAANLLFLLFAGLIMALSICGPEMLTRYRDRTMLGRYMP